MLLDGNPGRKLPDLRRDLPVCRTSPTMSPSCPDIEMRAATARILARLQDMARRGAPQGGHAIVATETVDSARVVLDHGGRALARASSNTPNLVEVCESPESAGVLRAIFEAVDRVIRTEPAVGAYDQRI